MSKGATLSSLLRVAARTEEDFVTVVQSVLDESDHARTAEFFDKMNIPRSVLGEKTMEPITEFTLTPDQVGDYEQEHAIGLVSKNTWTVTSVRSNGTSVIHPLRVLAT